jgi:hypothetical protein
MFMLLSGNWVQREGGLIAEVREANGLCTKTA